MLEKILSRVKDIRRWFDPQGGTYSKTPQIETGEGHVVFTSESAEYYNIYEAPADGRQAYKITITIFVENVGLGEEIYYAFHLGPTEGRRELSYPQILDGGPTTNEFCVYGEEPFQLWMPSIIDGFEVWYNYVVMYEP